MVERCKVCDRAECEREKLKRCIVRHRVKAKLESCEHCGPARAAIVACLLARVDWRARALAAEEELEYATAALDALEEARCGS